MDGKRFTMSMYASKEYLDKAKAEYYSGRVSYRVYADGRVVFQDDWVEEDQSLPYYDDYAVYSIPEEHDDYYLYDIPDELKAYIKEVECL